MPNHLAHEVSPYLLQHAENPVDWYPWGPEALAQARAENKPIFLSIGYSACHWCHVMERESFEDPDTAAILNKHFVCIKVDREQRPDLDSIYMQATAALTGSGGWPMSVFLTPELRPFYAGTYFPPVQRYDMPAFRDVLLSLARMWTDDPAQLTQAAADVTGRLQDVPAIGRAGNPSETTLETATAALVESYDWEFGGWGRAPKFPQPMAIEFLLRRAVSNSPSSHDALKAATHALRSMARGGMYDVIGGGFSRYSTDDHWRVPHFEKMLYDNAQLALTYLHAGLIDADPFYERIVIETLDFTLLQLAHPDGGFYSSLDADSEGEEGRYYVWSKDEILAILADQSMPEVFLAAYGVSQGGNWDGKNVLQRALDDASLAARFKIDKTTVAEQLTAGHRKLLAARERRTPPATDDKIITAWNALMLQAFSGASRYLSDPRKRSEYLAIAERDADFLLSALRPSGQLRRIWRNGAASREVFLEDFAALILGLLDLYQADFNNRWFQAARALADEMIERFSDPAGGFFDTPSDAEALLIRPKDLQDNATPSGNALATEALLRLSAFSDNGRYRDMAEVALRLVMENAPRYPTAFARWLAASDFAVAGGQQVSIVFREQAQALPLIEILDSAYRPNLVIAASAFPPADQAPTLLKDRSLQGNKATAYVCRNFVCHLPITTPAELTAELESKRPS